MANLQPGGHEAHTDWCVANYQGENMHAAAVSTATDGPALCQPNLALHINAERAPLSTDQRSEEEQTGSACLNNGHS